MFSRALSYSDPKSWTRWSSESRATKRGRTFCVFAVESSNTFKSGLSEPAPSPCSLERSTILSCCLVSSDSTISSLENTSSPRGFLGWKDADELPLSVCREDSGMKYTKLGAGTLPVIADPVVVDGREETADVVFPPFSLMRTSMRFLKSSARCLRRVNG